MVRAYIYLISFKDTNDIYIGKTIVSIKRRFQQHKLLGTVYEYVKKKFDKDWSNVYIDVIDSIDMNEDLTHLFNHHLNTVVNPQYNLKLYTSYYTTNSELLSLKLSYTEYFHIHNYKNDGKYNLINKRLSSATDIHDVYKFLNYTKTD